ncbi:hypothetical protein PAMC26510_22600 [Caballeronia sordidicola]|uniref:Uncharacterized protein n=1 Tax=Caballeronia sordidicola TaxID=196367 RepID=A0A242MLV6_CABSO|nr:hypothetical protein PAMC26510_22600 [Caballeronia sordidicola]
MPRPNAAALSRSNSTRNPRQVSTNARLMCRTFIYCAALLETVISDVSRDAV